jgi:Sporulation delaying protein SdpA
MLTLTALGGLLAVTLLAQLPAGIAAPTWLRAHQAAYRTVWPQAWSFFASTPNTTSLVAYRLDSNRSVRGPALILSMSAQDAWGLGRTAQAQHEDLFALVNLIPPSYWSPCSEPLSRRCLAKVQVYRLEDNFQPPLLCGLIAFIRAQPSAVPTAEMDGRPGSVAVTKLGCGG